MSIVVSVDSECQVEDMTYTDGDSHEQAEYHQWNSINLRQHLFSVEFPFANLAQPYSMIDQSTSAGLGEDRCVTAVVTSPHLECQYK